MSKVRTMQRVGSGDSQTIAQFYESAGRAMGVLKSFFRTVRTFPELNLLPTNTLNPWSPVC